jgi:hypothetical protein
MLLIISALCKICIKSLNKVRVCCLLAHCWIINHVMDWQSAGIVVLYISQFWVQCCHLVFFWANLCIVPLLDCTHCYVTSEVLYGDFFNKVVDMLWCCSLMLGQYITLCISGSSQGADCQSPQRNIDVINLLLFLAEVCGDFRSTWNEKVVCKQGQRHLFQLTGSITSSKI